MAHSDRCSPLSQYLNTGIAVRWNIGLIYLFFNTNFSGAPSGNLLLAEVARDKVRPQEERQQEGDDDPAGNDAAEHDGPVLEVEKQEFKYRLDCAGKIQRISFLYTVP